MKVVDASVLVFTLADDGPASRRAAAALAQEQLVAPELIDLEVLHSVRRFARSGALSEDRAAAAVAELARVPLMRSPHLPLAGRIWELRDNLSAYDAAYVALAERIEGALVTADRRLASAPGIQCEVELIA